MSDSARLRVRDEVLKVLPADDKELVTQADVIEWIDSGVEIFRLKKPDVPDKHLVSYFVLVDGDWILLVDHINAELWLPTGGHVEPDEHPQDTVRREVVEELGVNATFLTQQPLLITSTETVGKTRGHTDVSLWYALESSRETTFEFDQSEFSQVKWFHQTQLPLEQSDPELARFAAKLKTFQSA